MEYFNYKNLGAFIIPTGIGASIGGYAGDASLYAKEFSKICKIIVNPNVVNAGIFSGINDNMLYVEGYAIDEFFKGNIELKESKKNKIGIVFDKSIPIEILNIHINTINAVKTIYGINIKDYAITEEDVGVEFYIDSSGISTGRVKNIKTLLKASESLVKQGCEAIALVCLFNDDDLNENYSNGLGVDPIGGIEAIISHYITKELKVPCAHAPAFKNYEISTSIVNPKAAAEYITPTYLPCVLLGLNNAPLLTKNGNYSLKNIDFLIVPYNALGSIPVFEALKNDIKIYAIKENVTILNVTNVSIRKSCGINIVRTYSEALELIKNERKIIST
ncbi:DUF3326 domain-containing protein [bacterium]|nr:DUF3326 domain-containing protein [bacterium]